MMRRLLLPLLLLLPATLAAQSMTLDAERQVLLLMKILTYDRQFEKKSGDAVVVGIIYMGSIPESHTALESVAQSFLKSKGKVVKKLPLKYEVIEFTTVAEVEKAIKAKKVNVLYITPGLEKQLPDLIKLAQTNQLTSTTGVTAYVDKGIAVGVGFERNKPQIVINLPASKSEGSEFDASLLQIAEIKGRNK
jgi:hypothetical protein